MFRTLVFFVALLSCRLVSATPPNILLITLDTTRADRMGFLGSKRSLTPNLDILAKQSVVFTKAYAQVPLTTPSHAAILTGTYPQFSGVEDLGSRLPEGIPYLPDLLHKQGYHTAAFVGAEILDPASTAPGFERGFDVYDADFHRRKPGEDRYKSIERRAEDVANLAMGWLSHNQEKPFFLWLHFYDPHDPYDPPEPFKTRYKSVPYDGEIAYVDSVVGGLMEVLRKHTLFEDAVIAIAADHGEAFGEHGERRHGLFLYDETIHVPLLIKLPSGKFAGERVNQKVALADIAPSLLEAAAIDRPPAMQGHSLFALFDSESGLSSVSTKSGSLPGQGVYSETNYGHRTFGWAKLESWRSGKYLYVQAPRRELYDEASDSAASKNLAAASKAVADTLESQLKQFRQSSSSAESEQPKLDPRQVEKLRALGYMATDSGGPTGGKDSSVDPKDKVQVVNKFHDALFKIGDERFVEAIKDLREVVILEPEMGSGYMELGRALVLDHQYQEAVPMLRKAAEKLPDSAIAHYEFGLLLIKTKQWDKALPEMKAAVLCSPNSAVMHFDLAALETRVGRIPEAIAEYDKALAIDPTYFEANLTYGRLLLLEGHPEAAESKLSQAVKSKPESGEAHWFLAEAYERLGQTDKAAQERVKAGNYRPSSAN